MEEEQQLKLYKMTAEWSSHFLSCLEKLLDKSQNTVIQNQKLKEKHKGPS